jgi:hypothetical protein
MEGLWGCGIGAGNRERGAPGGFRFINQNVPEQKFERKCFVIKCFVNECLVIRLRRRASF